MRAAGNRWMNDWWMHDRLYKLNGNSSKVADCCLRRLVARKMAYQDSGAGIMKRRRTAPNCEHGVSAANRRNGFYDSHHVATPSS